MGPLSPFMFLTRKRSRAGHQQTQPHHCLHSGGCPRCQSRCPLKEAPGQGSHGRRLESTGRRNLLEPRKDLPTPWARGLFASPAVPRPCAHWLSHMAHRQAPKDKKEGEGRPEAEVLLHSGAHRRIRSPSLEVAVKQGQPLQIGLTAPLGHPRGKGSGPRGVRLTTNVKRLGDRARKWGEQSRTHTSTRASWARTVLASPISQTILRGTRDLNRLQGPARC